MGGKQYPPQHPTSPYVDGKQDIIAADLFSGLSGGCKVLGCVGGDH